MNRFFKWLLEIPGYPAEIRPGAQVIANPVVVNPTPPASHEFAKWRAGHIDRWLADPDNARHPNKGHLSAERDMHLASLRMAGDDE
jgi:hypothetical protein